jgi:hypothetical protein
MNQEGMLKPALIGGVVLGILSAIPIISAVNCLCCAWVIAGSMLAANLYVKSSSTAVTLGRGVGLGFLTGAIGAVVDVLFAIPMHLMMRGMGVNFMEPLREALEQIPNIPPETKEALSSIFAEGSGPGIFFIIAGGFFTLFIYSIVGMLGGALGVAIFEKRKPGPMAGPPPIPYPPVPPTDFPPPPPAPPAA